MGAANPTEETQLPQYYNPPEVARPSEVLGVHEQFLLHGRSGTGKTETAASAPEPQWWLTPGGRNELKTAFSPGFIQRKGRRNIFVTAVKEDREKGQMTDNPSGYDRCCDAVDSFLYWNQKEGAGVKTIVIDNATILEEYMMNKAIMAEYILASSKDKTVLNAERNFGIRKPHDSTWGGAQSFMDRFTNWLKELPFHLVFIAHSYESWEQQDEGKGGRKRILKGVAPLFVGAQRVSIMNKFDNVFYHYVQGGGRSLTFGAQTIRDEIVDAKIRVGGLWPEYVGNPNLSDIIESFKDHARQLETTEQGR